MGKVPHFAGLCWLCLLCDFLGITFGDDVVNESSVVAMVPFVAQHFILRQNCQLAALLTACSRLLVILTSGWRKGSRISWWPSLFWIPCSALSRNFWSSCEYPRSSWNLLGVWSLKSSSSIFRRVLGVTISLTVSISLAVIRFAVRTLVSCLYLTCRGPCTVQPCQSQTANGPSPWLGTASRGPSAAGQLLPIKGELHPQHEYGLN